jgi:hypothetical protein
VAVDDAYFAEAVQETFVEKFVGQVNSLVRLFSDQIEFGAGRNVRSLWF